VLAVAGRLRVGGLTGAARVAGAMLPVRLRVGGLAGAPRVAGAVLPVRLRVRVAPGAFAVLAVAGRLRVGGLTGAAPAARVVMPGQARGAVSRSVDAEPRPVRDPAVRLPRPGTVGKIWGVPRRDGRREHEPALDGNQADAAPELMALPADR
jgi:hypothetical protein